MNQLSLSILKYRSGFIKAIRSFFLKHEFYEIDTPVLKKYAGIDPYLDPMKVSSPNSDLEGFLITSPEYSLKQVISIGLEKVYELSHCFRSGERGDLHTREFLMLEFYQVGINEQELIKLCISLLEFLQIEFYDFGFQKEKCKIVSMESLFLKYLNIDFEEKSLLKILNQNFPDSDYTNTSYDDLFFLVFLNFIEPNFEKEFLFIFDYPSKLSALAKIENGRAKRFEIYYGRVELGNAFFELNNRIEQEKRFVYEQEKRNELKKEVFELDVPFLNSLDSLPDCSGIAIGLDRLFMIIMNEKKLSRISPYRGENA